MIYVKSPLNDHAAIEIAFRPNNTFTRCPKCGKEIPVDLSTFDEDELRNTMNYCLLCEECSLDAEGGKPHENRYSRREPQAGGTGHWQPYSRVCALHRRTEMRVHYQRCHS